MVSKSLQKSRNSRRMDKRSEIRRRHVMHVSKLRCYAVNHRVYLARNTKRGAGAAHIVSITTHGCGVYVEFGKADSTRLDSHFRTPRIFHTKIRVYL
jgi:hypothetical protein